MLRIVILCCIIVCASSFVIFPLPYQKSSTGPPGNTYSYIRTQKINQDAQVTTVNVKLKIGAQVITPALDLLPPKEIAVQPVLSQYGEDKVQNQFTSSTNENITLPQTDLLPPKLKTNGFQIQTDIEKTFETVTPTEAPKKTEQRQQQKYEEVKPLTLESLPPTEVATAFSPNIENINSDKPVQAQTSEGKKQTHSTSDTEPIRDPTKEPTVNKSPLPIIESIFETDLPESEFQPLQSTTTQNILPVTETEILTTEQPKAVTEIQDTYNEETPSQYTNKVTVTTPSDPYYATPEIVENVVRITPPTKQVQQKDILIENSKADENNYDGLHLSSVSEPEVTTIAIKTEESDPTELPNEEITIKSSKRENKSSAVIPENPSLVTVTTEVNNITELITLSLDLLPPEVINAELREPKTIELEEGKKVDTPLIDLLPPKQET